MKFLEIAELDILSRALNLSTPTLRVTTRVEAYSCKAVSREKKLFKALESELIQDLSHSTSVSPPEQHPGLLDSAFGPLDKRASRKTLWLLIGLLNVAFPDHDFSKVRPEEFRKEDGPRAVLASLTSALDHLRAPANQRTVSSYPPSSSIAFPLSPHLASVSLPLHSSTSEVDAAIAAHPFLRQVLDPIIDLTDCEVYTYTPDADSDPYAADSDDESEADGDSDAYERDDDGMAWEMDGINEGSSGSGSFSSYGNAGPSWQGGYGTPRKAFSSFLPPGTPDAFTAEPEEWNSSPNNSTGSLLCSSHHFLFNKKMKRILFISSSAHARNRQNSYLARQSLKRRASTSSVSSFVIHEQVTKRVRA